MTVHTNAIDNGSRSRLIEEFQILGFVEKGWRTGPSGAPYGSAGIVVNCPIVYRFLLAIGKKKETTCFPR